MTGASNFKMVRSFHGLAAAGAAQAQTHNAALNSPVAVLIIVETSLSPEKVCKDGSCGEAKPQDGPAQ